MKGSNTLLLNQATVIEALQEYLDKRYEPKVKVVSVNKDASQSYGDDSFKVLISEPEKNE